MADDKTSKSGLYLEQDENGQPLKVSETQPERGVQLVAPGGTITSDVQARIDAVKADMQDVVRGGPAPASAAGGPAPITSEGAAPKSKPSK